jgi:GT2 family glycosyltransferase
VQLSVIIVNYNAVAFLELCLHSVIKATAKLNAEVIVVDNYSTDDSLKMLDLLFKEVTVIANTENVGFAKANNIGVAAAQGTHLCILNPDTIVGEQVFDDLFAFAKANPKIALITTQLIDGKGNYLPESKRNVPTPKIARQKLMGNNAKYYATHLAKDENGQIEVLVGAMMFCQKRIYEQLGGFDTRYFMYGEDIDLSYTALQHGFTNYYLGSLKTIHFKGESTIKDKTYFKRFYGAMGLFYGKYFRRTALEKAIVKLAINMLIFTKNKPHAQVKSLVKDQVIVSNDAQYKPSSNAQKLTKQQFLSTQLAPGMQIIWDVTSLEYTFIIAFMATAVGRDFTYRFMSPQRDFILGSDSSTARGTTVKMH